MSKAEAIAPSNEKNCPHCGGAVSQKAKFCTHCGKKIAQDGPIAFPKVTETSEERQVKYEAVTRLRAFLDMSTNPDPHEVSDVFELLAGAAIPFADIQEIVLQLVEHPYRPIREQALMVIAADEKGSAKLLELLSDKRNWVRLSVIRALGRAKVTAAAPHLMHIFETEDDLWTRKDVLYALGEIQDIQAFNLFMRAVQQKDPELVKAAALGLQALGDPAAVQYLIAQITHPDESVREVVFEVIQSFGTKGVHPLLVAFAARKSPLELKKKILQLITVIPDPMAAPLLINALSDEPELIVQIIKVMAAWRFEEFKPALEGLAQHEDREVRLAAAAALRQKTLNMKQETRNEKQG